VGDSASTTLASGHLFRHWPVELEFRLGRCALFFSCIKRHADDARSLCTMHDFQHVTLSLISLRSRAFRTVRCLASSPLRPPSSPSRFQAPTRPALPLEDLCVGRQPVYSSSCESERQSSKPQSRFLVNSRHLGDFHPPRPLHP
jgi:hypothetical protein